VFRNSKQKTIYQGIKDHANLAEKEVKDFIRRIGL